jgi:hypothetical protein
MDPQNQSPPPPSSFPPPGGPLAQVDPKVRNLSFAMFGLALLLLIGTVTSSWASASERGADVGAGLRGLEMEARGRSASISWGDADAPVDIMLFGNLGFFGGLLCAAGAVAIGVFALTNKPNKIPPKAFNIVAGVTAAAMAGFLVRLLMDDEVGKILSISYSGFLALGGLIGIGAVYKQLEKARAGG